MALNDLTGQNIQDTYQRVVQTDGTNLADGTGSLLPISIDGNDVTISGSLTANEYIVSSSVTNITVATLSGSTNFGDSQGDKHKFTGSSANFGMFSNNDNEVHKLIDVEAADGMNHMDNNSNRGEFLNILKTNNKVALNLMTEFAIRLRKSDQQIEALSLDDAEHRIGVSILNLAEEMGIIRHGSVTVENLPYQQDIANMSGTSRETVSRVMKMFEERGLIEKTGHTLSIPDYAFFKRIFG